jgi:hypothetical protein
VIADASEFHYRRGVSRGFVRQRNFVVAAWSIALLAGCGRWGYEESPLCSSGELCAPGGPDASAVDPTAPDADPTAPDADPAAPDARPQQGGADAAVDVPGQPLCGSLQLLHETFDGGALNAGWGGLWRGAGGASITNDRVTLTLAAGSGDAEARYVASTAYDFRSSEIVVEVLRTAGRTTALELRDGQGVDRFMNFNGPTRGVAFAVESGQLEAQLLDGNGATTVAMIAYQATAHRHWRLRELRGVVIWDVSPDRRAWTEVHRQAVTMDTTAVYPILSTRGQIANASEAWFDNVNAPSPPVPGTCPADALRDDFEDGVISNAWSPWNGAGQCTLREINGRVELNFFGDFSACILGSRRVHDLRGSAIAYELSSVPTEGVFQTLIELRSARYQDRVELRINGTSMTMTVFVNDAQVFQGAGPFDRTAHRFGRLREAGGRLIYDTSPDGAAWSTRLEADYRFGASPVGFHVTGIHSGGGPSLQLQIGGVNAR